MPLKIVFLLFVFFNFSFAEKFIVGVYIKELYATKKESKIGAKIFLQQVNERYKNLDIEVQFFDDKEELLEKFKKKEVHVINSSPFFYYNNNKLLKELSSEVLLVSRTDDLYESFYIVKNKNSNFNLDNLNAKKVYFYNYLTKDWFESLVFKKYGKSKSILNGFKKVKKQKKLIFNIFFSKDSVSIIKKELYDSMLLLNPQIKDKIDIVHMSKPIFFDGITFMRKDVNTKFQKEIDAVVSDLIEDRMNIKAFEFIALKKAKRIKDFKELEPIESFFDEYYNLKKKYQ